MMMGKAPKGSSPKIREKFGLNIDVTLHTKEREGKN